MNKNANNKNKNNSSSNNSNNNNSTDNATTTTAAAKTRLRSRSLPPHRLTTPRHLEEEVRRHAAVQRLANPPDHHHWEPQLSEALLDGGVAAMVRLPTNNNTREVDESLYKQHNTQRHA